MERTRVATGGLFLLFWIKTAAEAQLPDFVGFSYSRADVSNPSSQRFISLLNEVNAIIVFRTKPIMTTIMYVELEHQRQLFAQIRFFRGHEGGCLQLQLCLPQS